MDPITSPLIVFTFVFVMYIVFMLGRPGYTPGCGAIPLKPEEFTRLLAKENEPLVFFYGTGFGGHYYFSCVKGSQISTKTKKGTLAIPENCELVRL